MKLVLIVEDEYGNAEVLRMLLEAEGYRVQAASNGKMALDLLRSGERPSLILSDFMMPVMTGGELGQAVRADAALSGIPLVFMSGTSEEVVRRVFVDYDDFLVKPIQIATLTRVLAQLIASGRPQRGAAPARSLGRAGA